jgi:hypothetical protein
MYLHGSSNPVISCKLHRAYFDARLLIVVLLLGASQAFAISGQTLVAPIGEAAGDGFGNSVASAGDVNGDGYDDMIVGAAFNDAGGDFAGRAYVYYLGPGADAVADLTLTGAEPGDYFGYSVSSAGDVNGDGYADVIVGALFNGAGGAFAGRAYVYYGGPGADAVADLTLTGPAPGDQFGNSVSSAGDMNGDGYDDVIVGTYQLRPVPTHAYVYYGGPGADAVPDLTLTGEAAYDLFGYSVSSVGDVSGDGYADVIVGAPFNSLGEFEAGRAYVYYGGPGANAVADLTLTGAGPGNHFGSSVSSAGDVNGDGFADIVVGAPLHDPGGTLVGRAHVYYGGPGVDAAADLTLTGATPGDFFGGSVSSAGDVNGDGYADVIVGANYSSDEGAYAGRAYVYYGGPVADVVADLTLNGSAAGDFFGYSVSSAGDVNGDGCAEVIVGAPFNNAGQAFVISTRVSELKVVVDLDPSEINLRSHAPMVTAYIEGLGFSSTNIDVSTIRLAGSVPTVPKFAHVGDHNANGIPDLMVKFSRPALDPLLTPGVNSLKLAGSLVTGESFAGTGEVRVIDNGGGHAAASVAPNPLNPSGILSFSTAKPGHVRVLMFDLHGSLVRTLMEMPRLPAGDHEVRIDGRGLGGRTLPSGVYFYCVDSPDGAATGHFAILK